MVLQWKIRSGRDNHWPKMPPTESARMLYLLQQFRDSQWLGAAEIEQNQQAQLQRLLRRAIGNIRLYRERLAAAGIHSPEDFTPERWLRVPLLTKAQLREFPQRLLNRKVGTTHGKLGTVQTSGSTGIPVKCRTTGTTRLIWSTIGLRDHEWAKRDALKTMGVIRYVKQLKDNNIIETTMKDWGAPTSRIFQTGPAAVCSVKAPVSTQLDWLEKRRPHYLLTYPSCLLEIAKQCLLQKRAMPFLAELRLFGETPPEETREVCREAFGDIRISDGYSANEVGYIALQCPEHDHLHVQSESLLVEVIDEAGRPCRPGQVGRVVLTTLHNFVMPLLRYEIGDYAEFGPTCACGRGLPVLKRVLGRVRNMLRLPNGESYWPQIGGWALRKLAPVAQAQFIQHGINDIEARLITERPLTPDEIAKVRDKILKKLHHPFELTMTFVTDIERGPTGKFEEFKSLLA
jgi:phenylacetate-CoA ligase